MKNPEKPRDLRALSQLYGELLERMSAEPDSEAWMILSDPDDNLITSVLDNGFGDFDRRPYIDVALEKLAKVEGSL